LLNFDAIWYSTALGPLRESSGRRGLNLII